MTAAVSSPTPCTCGHSKGAHDHYRRGSDCSQCDCRSYRAVTLEPLRRMVSWLRGWLGG